MPTKSMSRQFRDLARVMIKQAKHLRDAGLLSEARDLARRAVAFDGLGWSMREPLPALVRARR